MSPIYCEDLPGSYGNMIIGEGFDLYKKEQLFYIEKYYHYGSNYKTKILADKVAVLSDPISYKEILVNYADHFSSQVGWYVLEPYFGRGILLEDSELHTIYRTIFSSAFHKKAVSKYLLSIDKFAKQALSKSRHKNTKLFLVGRRFTLPIISEIIFGRKSEIFYKNIGDRYEKILLGFRDLFKLPFPNKFTDHGKALLAKDELKKIVDTELDYCINNQNFDSDFLVSLLAGEYYKKQISKSKILELILGIFFGGHDTTANLIFSSLILLDNNYDIKERLSRELTSISGSSFQDVLSARYLDAVIKECIRLYPPVPYIPRGVVSDIEISGISLKRGWHVHLCPLITHRNPAYFYSATKFKPERFLDNNILSDSFTFIPFGFGKHRCLGAELATVQMKIFIYNLFIDYHWKVLPSNNSTEVFSPFKLSDQYNLILEPTFHRCEKE